MRRRRFVDLRLWLSMAVAAVLAVGVMACGGSDDDSSDSGSTGAATEEKVEKLRVVVFPTTDQAAFFTAMDEGIFEKHGLDLDAQVVTDATALTAAVTSGKADVMHHAFPAMVTARIGGLDVKLISGVAVIPKEGYVEVLVKKDSGLENFGDLAGKTGAAAALRGIVDLGVAKAIEAEGGDPSTYTAIAVPPTEQLAALKANRVDAAGLNDPFLGPAKADPVVASLGNPFGLLDFTALSASAYSTDKIIAEKASALAKYKAALTEASELVMEDPARARKAITDHTELPPEVVEKIGLPIYDTEVTEENAQALLSAMDDLGWLEKPVTPEDILWSGN